ncbi:MAG: helix-turn-helix domain-containing protein [Candidatus Aenigmatarchaeota archaeon]
MVITAKLSDSLKTIKLNKYERNLWVALLARGSASAGELSDISKVPRSRCYDVLQSLADKGFVVVQSSKPLKYVAIQPKEALERAKKHVLEDAKEIGNKIDRLVKSDAIKDLERIYKDGVETVLPEEMTGTIRTRKGMHEQIGFMLKKSKKYVKLMTTEGGLSDIIENHEAAMQKAAKSGVKIHVLAPLSKNSEAVKSLSKYAQVRNLEDTEHVKKILARLCISDGEEFLVGLTDDTKIHPTQDISFWTQSRHASSNVFEPMFDLAWHSAKAAK